jgi:2-oxoglutarate ferredoxin oxidoreductase subunit delta
VMTKRIIVEEMVKENITKKGASGRIEIDRESCKGCGYCVEACPKKVIVLDTKFNEQGFYPAITAHLESCTGCAICANVCPDIAIEVWKDE